MLARVMLLTMALRSTQAAACSNATFTYDLSKLQLVGTKFPAATSAAGCVSVTSALAAGRFSFSFDTLALALVLSTCPAVAAAMLPSLPGPVRSFAADPISHRISNIGRVRRDRGAPRLILEYKRSEFLIVVEEMK